MATKSGKPKRAKDLKVRTPGKAKEKTVSGGRDPASGLPTGKRMHKPYVVT